MREAAVRQPGVQGSPLWGAVAILVLAVISVALLATQPTLLAILAAGVTALAFGLRFVRALPTLFLGTLGIVLAGYAIFGRSFAYLGVPPVFIGEATLVFALVAALVTGSLLAVLRSPVALLLLAFAALGALATIPHLGTYQLDALRDAALWGYGAFAVLVAACVLSTGSIPAVVRHYGRWITPLAGWLPVVMILIRWFGDDMPIVGGTDVFLFSTKPGDAGVHLAGAAIFVLAGLTSRPVGDRTGPRFRPLVFWVLWVISALFVTALNRGGFLAITVALLVIGFLEPRAVGKRVFAGAAAATLVAAVVLFTSLNMADTSQLATRAEDRAFSPRQVVENVLSIMGREADVRGNLSSTRDWRLDWWRTIADYTFFGEYFWSGKGFGVNLADDDGFQVANQDQAPLRSPHNAHMTVLARMGVPGALLWVALQICFGVSLVRAFLRARLAGAHQWARLNLWILGYWCAFLVNATFDVFLEGPHGGIWFWCVMGLGIAVLESQRRDVTSVRRLSVAS